MVSYRILSVLAYVIGVPDGEVLCTGVLAIVGQDYCLLVTYLGPWLAITSDFCLLVKDRPQLGLNSRAECQEFGGKAFKFTSFRGFGVSDEPDSRICHTRAGDFPIENLRIVANSNIRRAAGRMRHTEEPGMRPR